ncbi:MAG: MaoC family dehydratase N-terminal domain-containing protein [Chloroflexi bacterium]|nr:MaoC family dehydratase N-terminal domain-containing protein [Chloroflexota bacterium]
MTTQPDTLVTQDMIERKGKFSEPRVAPPIALSDIRKWAIAVYWPDTPPPLYWDEDYAKTTRYGGIIAPLDFNPFAWPVHRDAASSGRATAQGGGVGTRGMNGGQTEEYFEPMRAGDVISTTTGLTEWEERTTRLGPTLFTTTETRWTNQKGELVKVRRSIGIRY